MVNKKISVLLTVSFVIFSLILMSSCTQKRASVTEVTPPPSSEMEKVTPPPKAPPVTDDAAERARQARLKAQREAEMLQKEIRGFESETIYFDFDRSELKPEARAILSKKADWLRTHSQYAVEIQGHCDERGTNEYNLALGERRANAAWKYLNALGVSAARMNTISYGEERPADPGHNESAWAKNRRAEFRLMKK